MIRTAAALLPLALSGCVAIPFSALGSISSLGDSNVSVGRDAYSFGKLRSAELVEMFAAEDAARLAARDLGMHVSEPAVVSDHGTRIDMQFADDKGLHVGVRIDQRTRTLTALREDVGWLGSLSGEEIFDRLFLQHLRQHLPREPAADTRPADTRPPDTRPADTRPPDTRPAGSRP